MERPRKRDIEGYRKNWGAPNPLNRPGLPIPDCPWTEAQLAIMASLAQGEKYKTIAANRGCAVGTVKATLSNARLATFADTEDPLPLRELIASPQVQRWLEQYREIQNG